ncbi:MAG: hypothetical protein K1W37_17690 [Lachnospiraceae bacterium]|jgi:hypothetical protein
MAVGLKEDLFPFGYDKRAYTKTDRNKYNEALEDMMLNSGKIIAEYGMVKLSDAEKRNMRKRRLLFNPIELE